MLTKVRDGARGRVSSGSGSGKSIGNVGTWSGAVGVGAVVEWVCKEVGKVGVEERGADRLEIVAVDVVKIGCSRRWWTLWGLDKEERG